MTLRVYRINIDFLGDQDLNEGLRLALHREMKRIVFMVVHRETVDSTILQGVVDPLENLKVSHFCVLR